MTQKITELPALRKQVSAWRASGGTIALVPTMGALHDGHLALVHAAQKQAQHVIVSIFVNPTQFGPNEDFNRYPRPLAQDLALLEAAGADAAWVPAVTEMYAADASTLVQVSGISEGLCGAIRPGHFDGVATVVSKLLLQTMPDVALFGEKDYQQLCVIHRLVRDLNIPANIMGVPTVREKSGLALSSRNQYLSAPQRTIAAQLYATLQASAAALRSTPTQVDRILTQGKASLMHAGFDSIDYFELRTEESLIPCMEYKAPARLLVAARLGNTRLIDNLKIE